MKPYRDRQLLRDQLASAITHGCDDQSLITQARALITASPATWSADQRTRVALVLRRLRAYAQT
jgi:hypothetical protein